MNILLYLPGVLLILFKRHGLVSTLRHTLTILATQALIAWPFVSTFPLAYLQNAFDLSRVFLYKWTVNWRFLEENSFLSPQLARSLLIAHASTLAVLGIWRWCQRDGGVRRVLERGLRRPTLPASIYPVTADCSLSQPIAVV